MWHKLAANSGMILFLIRSSVTRMSVDQKQNIVRSNVEEERAIMRNKVYEEERKSSESSETEDTPSSSTAESSSDSETGDDFVIYSVICCNCVKFVIFYGW